MTMVRNKKKTLLEFAVDTTDVVQVDASGWWTIEVADGDKAIAITVQTLSEITGGWVNVLTIADTTNAFKQLTAAELAAVGPLSEVRFVFGSTPSTKKLVVHQTS